MVSRPDSSRSFLYSTSGRHWNHVLHPGGEAVLTQPVRRKERDTTVKHHETLLSVFVNSLMPKYIFCYYEAGQNYDNKTTINGLIVCISC